MLERWQNTRACRGERGTEGGRGSARFDAKRGSRRDARRRDSDVRNASGCPRRGGVCRGRERVESVEKQDFYSW